MSLIHFANVIHPRIFEEIKKADSLFWRDVDSVNVLEFFPNYGSINGIIWKGNSVYYSFIIGADKKLSVQGRTLTQLEGSTKIIIQNFANWNNSIFSINGAALNSPTDHPFYFASTYKDVDVSSIGFYYY